MAKRYMKRCSTSLTRDKKIRTTVSYHLMPIGMASIKKSKDNKGWRGYGEKGNSCAVSGNANWYSQHGKQYGSSSNN